MILTNIINNLSKQQIDNVMQSNYNLVVLYSSNELNPANELLYYADICPNIETAMQCKQLTKGFILHKTEFLTKGFLLHNKNFVYKV